MATKNFHDLVCLDFPDNVTLTEAEISLQFMGEKTITAEVDVYGDLPKTELSIRYGNDVYVTDINIQSAKKENTSEKHTISLTFIHEAIKKLRSLFFYTLAPAQSGTTVADKYEASVSLSIGDFVTHVNDILKAEGITDISIEKKAALDSDKNFVSISYTHLWELIGKIYEVYGFYWELRADDYGKYKIYVSDSLEDIDYTFQYEGTTDHSTETNSGGLVKISRNVESSGIFNHILGRGGDKNIPYRYFKAKDSDEAGDNSTFEADPDNVPELKSVSFDRLRDSVFRNYVIGWKKYKDTTWVSGKETYLSGLYGNDAYLEWARTEGANDAAAGKFRPIEYVDDRIGKAKNGDFVLESATSTAAYGERWGALESDDTVFPTIQGMDFGNGKGRVDEIVDVTTGNDIPVKKEPKVLEDGLPGGATQVVFSRQSLTWDKYVYPQQTTHDDGRYYKNEKSFEVKEGMKAVISMKLVTLDIKNNQSGIGASVNSFTYKVLYRKEGATEYNELTDFTPGIYFYKLHATLERSESDKDNDWTGTLSWDGITVTQAEVGETPQDTFDIWVKDIWGSVKNSGESDVAFAERVWKPILGDHLGNEAKVVFSSGWLSVSEDYEFTILKMPEYDTSKKYTGYAKDSDGKYTVPTEMRSMWKITLVQSTVDMNTTGRLIPNSMTKAVPGDTFFFIGIDLPYEYYTYAEHQLYLNKIDYLNEMKEPRVTYEVELDKIAIETQTTGRGEKVRDMILPGKKFRLQTNKTFDDEIPKTGYTPSAAIVSRKDLIVQGVTIKYVEPTDTNPALLPDVSVTLTDKPIMTVQPIQMLEGEVEELRKVIGTSLSGVERAVSLIGDRRYLRKDGVEERSVSPTQFASNISSDDFRIGGFGGAGWSFYKNGEGKWTMETDRVVVRDSMVVNELIINQASWVGGMRISSIAAMEVSQVEEIKGKVIAPDGTEKDGIVAYRLFFDRGASGKVNMFVAGDFIYCQQFSYQKEKSDEGKTQANPGEKSSIASKFYRREVLKSEGNYIEVSNCLYTEDVTQNVENVGSVHIGYKEVPAPNRPGNTGNELYISTSGAPTDEDKAANAPAKGDNVIQYGNRTSTYRQCVKIEDVYGGGYTRYLRGINTVSSSGEEYYYVGMHGSNTPKFFIGEKGTEMGADGKPTGNYLEWDGRTMTVKGSVEISPADKAGIVSEVKSKIGDVESSVVTKVDKAIRDSIGVSTEATSNLDGALVLFKKRLNSDASMMIGEGEAVNFKQILNNITTGYEQTIAGIEALVSESSKLSFDEKNNLINKSNTLTIKYGTLKTTIENSIADKKFTSYEIEVIDNARNQYNTALQEVEKASATTTTYGRYLTGAIKQSTTIDGGLITSSIIRLGSNGNTKSGLSGVVIDGKNYKDIALWVGGDNVDREDHDTFNWNNFTWTYKNGHSATTEVGGKKVATGVIRMDGTGYLAGGNFMWNKDGKIYAKADSFMIGESDIKTIASLFKPSQRYIGMATMQDDSSIYELNITKINFGKWNNTSLKFERSITMGFHETSNGIQAIRITRYDGNGENLTSQDFGFYTYGWLSAMGMNATISQGGARSLKDLSDVSMAGASNGTVLVYNGSSFEFRTIQTGGMDTAKVEELLATKNYATQAWVNGNGYLTSSSLSGYATESWVSGRGYLTSSALSGYATQSWVQGMGYLTSGSISNMVTTNTTQDVTGFKWFGNHYGQLYTEIEQFGMKCNYHGGKYRFTSYDTEYVAWIRILYETSVAMAITNDGQVFANYFRRYSDGVSVSFEGHTHSYLPLSGGNLTGPLTFANNTWNLFGNDCYMGDNNIAGCVCFRSSNRSHPGFRFYGNRDNYLAGMDFSDMIYTHNDISLNNAHSIRQIVAGGGLFWNSPDASISNDGNGFLVKQGGGTNKYIMLRSDVNYIQKYSDTANPVMYVQGNVLIEPKGTAINSLNEGIRISDAPNGFSNIHLGYPGISGDYIYGWSIMRLPNKNFLIGFNSDENKNVTFVTDHSSYVNMTASNLYSRGVITARSSSSDIRLKTKIDDFDALSIIRKIRPVSFNWNDLAYTTSPALNPNIRQYGMIAQEVQLVPECSAFVTDFFKDFYTLSYEKFIPIALKGIKEIDDEVHCLRKRVFELEGEMAYLRDCIKTYEVLSENGEPKTQALPSHTQEPLPSRETQETLPEYN